MKWITRSHVHVDRVACPWLITRFVDNEAEFLFVPANQVKKVAADTGAIPFDAPDGKPVQSLFVLLVPEQATDLHLQVLSELAQLFSSRPLREQLLSAASADELYQLLSDWSADA